MLVNLKTIDDLNEQQSQDIEIGARLPGHLRAPCIVHCQFDVKVFKNYYLLTLRSESLLTVICQRCLGEFSNPYKNQTELAVCDSDETAERMMHHYDCIVSDEWVDLQALLTDELYLYSPEFHLNLELCDHEMERFFRIKS